MTQKRSAIRIDEDILEQFRQLAPEESDEEKFINQALREIGFSGTSTLDMYGYPLPEQGYRWGLPVYRRGLKLL